MPFVDIDGLTTAQAELWRAVSEMNAEARQVMVTACGDTAPYIKIALANIDAAIAAAS